MNYSDMSDFEINCAVAFHIGLSTVIMAENREFDPCNSWAGAGPVIADNHIAVVPYQHSLPQAWPTAFGMVSKFATEDKNPLRAAMIVFLVMKEAE